MPLLQVKQHPPSGTIILQRAARRHALNRALIAELKQAFGDLHQQLKVRAVILTGGGDTFCAGLDLAEIQETRQTDDPLPQWHADVVQYRDLLLTMLRFPKPIIAAVNGPALGAGAALLLASDLVIGCSEATVGFPETRRGLISGLAAPLLTFRTGGSLASRMLLTGEALNGDQAEAAGLFHELAPRDALWARAHEQSQLLAQCAPESLQLTKKMLNETVGETLQTMLSAGAAASATARTTEAAAEGVDAFLERRPPRWPAAEDMVD